METVKMEIETVDGKKTIEIDKKLALEIELLKYVCHNKNT